MEVAEVKEAVQDEAEFYIEALSDKHDRSAFSCGVEQVDNYLHKTAGKLDRANNTRVRVMVSRDGALVGFYAMNAHAIDYEELPKKFGRDRPGHGSIPAAFISMIGRDQRYRGQSVGQDLLVDALLKIVDISADLGIAVVVLDVLNCGNPKKVENRLAIYKQFGFTPLESEPLRLFIPVKNIVQSIEAALKEV